MALAPEDDLEDLARGRRGVQHHDPQLPLHARPSCSALFLPPPFPVSTATIACLPHMLLMSVHQMHAPVHDSLTTLCQEGAGAFQWPVERCMWNEKLAFRSLEVREEYTQGGEESAPRPWRAREIHLTNCSRRITIF